MSLVADGVAALLLNTTLSAERAQAIAAVSAVIALCFANQRSVSQGVAKVRRSQNHSRHAGSRRNAIVVTALLAALVFAKLIFLPTLNNFASLLAALILLVGIASSLRHLIRESRARTEALRISPWLYITLWERQLVVLFCIPMIAARCISLCGALSLGTMSHPYFAGAYLATSIVLLLILQPQRSAFMGWCPLCKSPTPVAFVEYGSCPKCDSTLANSGLFY